MNTAKMLYGTIVKYDKFGSGTIQGDDGAHYFFRVSNLAEQVRGMRVTFRAGKPAKGKKLAEAAQVRTESGGDLPVQLEPRSRQRTIEDVSEPAAEASLAQGEMVGFVVNVNNHRQFAHARIEHFSEGDVFLHFRRARGQPLIREGDRVHMRVVAGSKGPIAEYWYKPDRK